MSITVKSQQELDMIPLDCNEQIFIEFGTACSPAILKNKYRYRVEAKIDDIIMPENTNGKARTKEVTVVREIPLEECGIFGKILAKRRK